MTAATLRWRKCPIGSENNRTLGVHLFSLTWFTPTSPKRPSLPNHITIHTRVTQKDGSRDKDSELYFGGGGQNFVRDNTHHD